MKALKTSALLILLLCSLVGCGGGGAAIDTAVEPAVPQPVDERIPQSWKFDLNAQAPTAPEGMVVTDAELATEVGVNILEQGGNAIDAAVATAFALAVVYPEAGNIGGGGFLVTAMGDSVAALDFREQAPLASTQDMYLNEEGEPTDKSIIGPLAAGVPGSVAGLRKAWERFGTMPWDELLQPAIELAAEGFVVNERFAATVASDAEDLAKFSASAELFLPGGEPLEAGQTWKNPDLAATLRRIAEEGRAGFYSGKTADLIVQTMERTGGIITHEDLRQYEAKWREPVVFEYRGHKIIGMPPPSSGGITMALMAGILAPYDLGAIGWHAPRSLHLMTEAMRRAFAVRNHFLADPDHAEIPRDRLLSEAFADSLQSTITRKAETPSDSINFGSGRDSRPSHHTTQISVVDGQGNAVAITTTINFLYGSKVTVAEAGFVLNNEMNDFTVKPGAPNAYGLVQGKVNAIEPGKRPLSSMSPAIVLKENGEPLIVTGARGGPRIITAAFQIISNVVDHGFELAAAVNAPRVHHQHLPDKLFYEPNGLTDTLIGTLEKRGYEVVERDGMIGSANTILRRGDRWAGFPDPRSGGAAAGY